MYKIKLSSYSQKFLKKIDNKLKIRIISKLKELSKEPFPPDTKRIINKKEKTFRIRVGDYRILYCVFHEKKEILIADIDKRSRIY